MGIFGGNRQTGDNTAYVVTASHPSGAPYQTPADRALHSAQPSATVPVGGAALAETVRTIEAAGLTAHVRPA